MNFLLRLFLTLSSVSFFVIVYLVKNKLFPNLDWFSPALPWLLSICYLTIPFIVAFISLYLSKKLAPSNIKGIQSIEVSNNDFLANYLAFFFVALSVDDTLTFFVVFGVTIVFTFVSRVSYFNPVFLIFGYTFYYVVIQDNIKIMLISKQNIKTPKSINEIQVRRINDYTFIEI
jgi:hypothetical protein